MKERRARVLVTEQADFIRFSYGLTFVIGALVCGLTRSDHKPRLPWRWFALFAAAHGLNEWAGLIPNDSALFSGTEWAEFALWTASFAALGVFALEGSGRGRAATWAGVTLLPGAATLPWGMDAAKATLCLSLVLPATVGASVRLLRAWWRQGEGSAGLWWVGVWILAFGVFSGLVPPRAPFFPASVWNEASFLRLTGVPVWLPRGMAAAGAIVGLWLHVRETVREASRGAVRPPPAWLGAVFIGIVACGWALTEGLGRFAAERTRLEARLVAECVARRWTALAGELAARVKDAAQAAWAREILSGSPTRRAPAKAVGISLLDDPKARPVAGDPLPTPPPGGLWSVAEVQYWIGPGEQICARTPVGPPQDALLGYIAACALLVEPGTGLFPGTVLGVPPPPIGFRAGSQRIALGHHGLGPVDAGPRACGGPSALHARPPLPAVRDRTYPACLCVHRRPLRNPGTPEGGGPFYGGVGAAASGPSGGQSGPHRGVRSV